MFFVIERPPLLELDNVRARAKAWGRGPPWRHLIIKTKAHTEEMTALQEENRDILLRLLSTCNTFSGKDASSLYCVIQDCSNKLNPQVWISLRAAKLNYELAECKPVVGNHTVLTSTPRSYLLSSVCIFAPDCFEQTFHIEGASIRLITCAIPTNWK